MILLHFSSSRGVLEGFGSAKSNFYGILSEKKEV